MTATNTTVQPKATRPLIIGRAWQNDRATPENRQPQLRIKLDRDLGLNITLAANSTLALFQNKNKRSANSPEYVVSVDVPRSVADAEIARQRAARGNATAVQTS